MNKKIASEIAIGILIFLAIIFAVIFWLQGNQIVEAPSQPALPVMQIDSADQSNNLVDPIDPVKQVAPAVHDESGSKPNDDPRIAALETAVFAAVNEKTKGVWDKKVDMSVPSEYSQEVAKGKWWAKDAWDWIAWLQSDGTWKVLISFDGFDCKALESVPAKFDDYLKNVIYPAGSDGKNSKNKYCYNW